MKVGTEMFVCSWMTSSAIILQDEKQNKPTLTTDQSGIKGKRFFHGLDNWQPFSLSTQFLSIIRQLCKVDTCCLYFPDELVRKQKSFTKQEGANEPTDELINQNWSQSSSLQRWHDSWFWLSLIVMQPLGWSSVSVKSICLESNPDMAVTSMQRMFSPNED